jgi:hypothetical protein
LTVHLPICTFTYNETFVFTTFLPQLVSHLATMRRVILFYTVLFALLPLVFAHPNFNYAVRSDITLVSDNTTLVLDTAAAATEKRGSSLLAAGLSSPWPEVLYNGHRIRPITYCYTNKAIRDRLECNVVNIAIGRWLVKLNSRGFSGTTNVRFEEAHDYASGAIHYCFDDQGQWNVDVHEDALWIDIQGTNGQTGWSTVGWAPPALGGAGRHKMHLAELNNPAQMTDIATHEVKWSTSNLNKEFTDSKQFGHGTSKKADAPAQR